MTYLHRKKSDDKIIEYEYGAQENIYIGSISFDNSKKDFSERNIKLIFYGNNSFCKLTTDALQTIAKFIREDNFPDNYLRATH